MYQRRDGVEGCRISVMASLLLRSRARTHLKTEEREQDGIKDRESIKLKEEMMEPDEVRRPQWMINY